MRCLYNHGNGFLHTIFINAQTHTNRNCNNGVVHYTPALQLALSELLQSKTKPVLTKCFKSDALGGKSIDQTYRPAANYYNTYTYNLGWSSYYLQS